MAVKGEYGFEQEIAGIRDGEPVFILRGQDLLAPMVVRYWAELAAKMQVPTPKVLNAFSMADRMAAWSGTKKVPD